MAKYNKQIVKKICSLIKEDSYTIVEICQRVGISEDTYHEWKKNKADFSESIKSAQQTYIDKMLTVCNNSLAKLMAGYEVEEKKVVTVDDGHGKPKIKEQTITKKIIGPNLGAIIHFQTNRDPENWKNKQNTEVTGKDGKDLFPKITIELIDSSDKIDHEDSGSS